MSEKDHAPSRRSSFGPTVRLLCIGSALATMGSTVAASEESGIDASTNLGRIAGKLLRHDTRALVIGDSTFAEANDTIGFWSTALQQWRAVHWHGFGYDNPRIQNGYNGFCGYNRAMEGFETRLRDRCDGRIGLLSIEELHQRRFGDLDDASPATTDLVHPNKFGANIMMRDAWDQIVQHAAPAGDLDGDVDAADFGLLLQAWGQPGGPADLNGDGIVNAADMGLLFIAWGRWLP